MSCSTTPHNRSSGVDAFGGSAIVHIGRTLATWVRCSATAGVAVRATRAVLGLDEPGHAPGTECDLEPGAAAQPTRGRDTAGASIVVAAAMRTLQPAMELSGRFVRTAVSVAMESVTANAIRALAVQFDRVRDSGFGRTSLALHLAGRLKEFLLTDPAAAGVAFILCVLPFAPTTGLVVICVLMCGFQVLRLIHAGASSRGVQRAHGGASDIPAAFFAFVVFLAAVASISRRASAPALVLWAAYLALYFVALTSRPSGRAVRAIAAALLLCACVVSALGILQFIQGGETSASWIDTKVFEDVKTRVYSVFDNPNMLAEFLAFALPLGVALILANPRSLAVLLYAPAIGLGAVCLALTYSRGGWVATFIGVMAVLMTRSRRLALAFLVLMLIAAPLLPQSIQTRAVTALTMQDSSTRYRLTIWKSALRMVHDYWPIGIGLGSGAFEYVYPAYEIAGTPAAHTHNLYLQILVEMGIPGFLMFLWLLLGFAREVARAAVTRAGVAGAALAGTASASAVSAGAATPCVNGVPEPLIFAALAGSIVGQAVHGVIDNIWYSPKNVFMFWAILGLTLAMARTRRAGIEA